MIGHIDLKLKHNIGAVQNYFENALISEVTSVAVLSEMTVTAPFSSKQLLQFDFAGH